MITHTQTRKTDEKEILLSCLAKARNNGYRFRGVSEEQDEMDITSFDSVSGRMAIAGKSGDQHQLFYQSVYQLFFEIRFARSFFGSRWEQEMIKLAEAKDKLGFLKKHLVKNHGN